MKHVGFAALLLASWTGPARAEVQASGKVSPPYKNVCAQGTVVMARVQDHIEVMGYAATAGTTTGQPACNTWGPKRTIQVAFTVYWSDGLDVEVCGNKPAYPGWLQKLTDVLDLVDPISGDRRIDHHGCGPGWYATRLHSYYWEDGKWRGGYLDTKWEHYDLPPLPIVQ